ncbi:hypothetical protein RchiOBHm_Chr2g0112531 [Rosa chinensis]|uniref:Uncharacterized protein n=1 Tax=Rosa chinensis TaxID=74649 RepID=A0A2P6RQ89_ROSCH|nr:hypothetical protein RchiOBHm_Chr2g0112531 [Rosa chinensis]
MAEILPGWVSISGNHPNSFSLLSPDLSSSGSALLPLPSIPAIPATIRRATGHHRGASTRL